MATSKKFSELTAASSLTANDLAAVAHVDAQAETGYESQKATMSQLGQYLNKEMQYATDLSKFPVGSQSPIPALNNLRDFLYGQLPVNSASGSIANFTTSLALPLVALKTYIKAQGGGGTPSAPIAITGFDSIKIGQTSGSADLATYFRGIYQGRFGFVDLGSLTWTDQSTATYQNRFKANITDATASPMVCFGYTYKGVGGYGNIINEDKSYSFNNGVLNFHDSSCDTASDITNALNGNYLIYELATPTTPTITTEQFATLCQAFGITGNIFTIQLGQTCYGGYIDKNTGKLVITYGEYTITGNETFSATGAGQHIIFTPNLLTDFFKSFANNVNANVLFECGESKTYSALNVAGTTDGIGIGNYVIIGSEQYDHWSDFVGKKIYAQLKTPIETDITIPDITALVGEQNIFADSGDIDVSYKMGVQEYIDKKIAETQALVL